MRTLLLEANVYIKKIRAIGGDIVVRLHALENKIEIMKRKSNLAEVGIGLRMI